MPDAYNPVLRNGENERQVIQSFGGFNHFDDSEHDLALHPIVAVTSEEDLGELHAYRDAGNRVYVDLPEYLGDKATKFTEDINETIDEHGSRESFFRSNSDEIQFPMISGFPDRPVEYGIHISIQSALEDEYSQIAHRLMVASRTNGLSDGQKETLKELVETIRPQRDVVMFDVVDIELGEDNKVEDDLKYLAGLFEDFETGVLNAFNAMQGQPDNHSPGLADRFGCTSFGDFAIDRRYPSGGGRPESVTLPHYHPNHATAELFPGEDYAAAGEKLLEWEDWDTDHCDFCTDIATLVELGAGQNFSRWKRNRMGHYIESVLRGTI